MPTVDNVNQVCVYNKTKAKARLQHGNHALRGLDTTS